MNKRVQDKISQIERFLEELKEIIPDELNAYKTIEKKAACERYAEKIIEAVTDLAFLAIKYKKLQIPEDDVDAFKILLDNKIIGKDEFEKLSQAKGMRNIIAHEYGKIDDKIVFEALKNELEGDVIKFIKKISAVLSELR